MKKLIKKSLAFCLVTMLVLTAFVGAFGVSAESATVTAGSIEVEAGATTVTVPVTITAADGFYAAYIQVASDFGALTAVEVPADADYDVTADGYTAVDLATGKMLVMSIYGDDLRNDITSATVNCTFTATEAPAAGEYAVTVTLPDVPAADWSENVVALTATNGVITVKEAAPVGPVLDENIKIGTHTISMGDTFGIGFRYVLSSLSSDYASYRFDIKRTIDADGSFNFGYKYDSITSLTPHTGSDQLMVSTYYGIELFSLTAPIEYTLHCFDADGNEVAYSKTYTTTLADVAIAYHDSTSNVKIKKTIADLIQVGAAALAHFTNGKDCDFATLPVPSIDSPYVSTELLEDFTMFTAKEGKDITVAAGVTEKPYLSMRFKDTDPSKYSYKVSYYNALTKQTVNDVITSDEISAKSGYLFAYYRNLPVFASDADVTIELYEVGNDNAVATYHYSLETYYDGIVSRAGTSTLKTLVQELAELAQSFRAVRNI